MTDSLWVTMTQTIHTHHLFARVANQPDTGLPHVLVALSGGCDSVVLLHALQALGYPVSALHMNHNLRGAEAVADQQFCVQLCHQLQIPLQVVDEQVADYASQHKLSLEQAGRTLRYSALAQHCQAIGAAAIATGHHADDSAETLLLNLVRGTGLAGLTGIAPVRGDIVRPLIDCTRDQIEAYAHRHHLSYQTDSTNYDITFTRNRLRHELLSLLQQLNPQIHQTLKRTADTLAQDNAYLQQLAQSALLSLTKGQSATLKPSEPLTLAADELITLDPAIQVRVLSLALSQVLGQGTTDLSHRHLQSLLALAHKPTGKSVDLPHGITVTKSYAQLVMSQKKGVAIPPAFCYTIGLGSCVYIEAYGVYVSLLETPQPISWQQPSLQIFQNLYTKPLIYDRIAEACVTVRTKQPGDYVQIPNLGRQSLKKFFINHKIPAHKRHPLVCAQGHQVLCLPGIYADTAEPQAQTNAYLQIWRPMTPLLTEKEIKERVSQLGQRIRADYAFKPLTLLLAHPHGLFFFADLARELDAGMLQLRMDLADTESLSNQHVLVVTVSPSQGSSTLQQRLHPLQPRSIKMVCLLTNDTQLGDDYIGFQIAQDLGDSDNPLVGYGLSHHNQYSNLKFIGYVQ